eukprot:2011416-Pyramimonas_sp.AAC.1
MYAAVLVFDFDVCCSPCSPPLAADACRACVLFGGLLGCFSLVKTAGDAAHVACGLSDRSFEASRCRIQAPG